MIAKYNGIVYKDNDLQLFSTGAIFVKPLKRAFWIREFEFIKDDDTIDLNDTVTVELTEWGAVYLNALNTYRRKIATGRQFYRTDYKEGAIHTQYCHHCDKEFVYTTSISYYYEVDKADCLNGGEHVWELTPTFPKYYATMQCKCCGKRRQLTEEERKKYNVENDI